MASQTSNSLPPVSFSHLHLYVDELQDVSVYKALEDRLNAFAKQSRAELGKSPSIAQRRQLWKDLTKDDTKDPDSFVPQNRDVVQQLLSSFGFCVTATRYPPEVQTNTRSVLVTSRDPKGVQIVVTALEPNAAATISDAIRHFDAKQVQRFLQAHDSRPGIGVLAFETENIEAIRDKYQELHPQLVADYAEYGDNENTIKVLEVYAYYQPHDSKTEQSQRLPDTGTILRFLQAPSHETCALPGLTPIPATFDESSQPAYCDHWVSNVFSRTEFLDTLHDTLGFMPKVDFNAGVVAAGEAQIESTVTGNESLIRLKDPAEALKDQSQVYLPINNALSSVGHVHGFLQELGQGVQHVASRVENLVDFVQRGNEYRKITGEGFTFLRIPRSYYGTLMPMQLHEGIVGDGSDGVSEECAQAIFEALQAASALGPDGAVDLELTGDQIAAILEENLIGAALEEYKSKSSQVVAVILRSRYKNLYSLLRHHVSEETYLGIVRNQILVDIQGEDLLYQIFTSNILQRKAGDEAPFFEFIQRVCSECLDEEGCPQAVRPGCGGFGIRNFLTLFLSIEVSKAMQEVSDAKAAEDEERLVYAQKMVDNFTDQLNEANPILTMISDAMTDEGNCKEKMMACIGREDMKGAAEWKEKMDAASDLKQQGNQKLMECSARYNTKMKSIREARQTAENAAKRAQ